ncbi:Transcriptional repressor MprA [compost metagenome]
MLLEAGLVSQVVDGRRTLYSACEDALSELRNYLAEPEVPQETVSTEGASDAIALAARRWADTWPGQDPHVYAVTQRLLMMGRYVERALKETAERHGLQGSELLLLDALNLTPEDSLTPSQLQSRLGLSKGAVTKLMSNLESLGLLQRTGSQEDRRISHVALTSKAHETLANILNHHEYGADHAAAKRLPPERLAKLSQLLQEYHSLMSEELLRRHSR